jgi:septum site-determining protein MinC
VKSSVVLKSYPEGISVILDESVTYEDILKDVALKFSEAKAFLKDASLVVSLEGRRLTSCQEKEILNVITENSQLNVLCLIGNDDENKAMFSKVRKEIEYRENENCGQFYKGSLKNGQSIETER